MTTPYTDSTVSTLTAGASSWANGVRDNLRAIVHHSTGGAPLTRVYNSANLNSFSTGTAVTFDSERIDIGGMHSGSSSRLTVPSSKDGTYHIGAHIRAQYNYDGSGTGDVIVSLKLNGTTFIARQSLVMTETKAIYLSVATLYPLVATDYVETIVDFSEASSVDIVAGSNYSPEMWAYWIGE